MTTHPQFHEGQEVEVTDSRYPLSTFSWRKATIIKRTGQSLVTGKYGYLVLFSDDGARAVFDAKHIRAVSDEDAEIFRVGDLHP